MFALAACAPQITMPASHSPSKVMQSQLKGRHFSLLEKFRSRSLASNFLNNISTFFPQVSKF
jgi:hypothetical protein